MKVLPAFRLMRPPPVMVRSPAPLMTPVWVRSEPPVRRVDGPLTVMALPRPRWTVLDRSRVAPPPRVMAPEPYDRAAEVATSVPLATLIEPVKLGLLTLVRVTVPGPLTVRAPAEVLFTRTLRIVSESAEEAVRTTSSPPAVSGET